jgi:hypothetical protein
MRKDVLPNGENRKKSKKVEKNKIYFQISIDI